MSGEAYKTITACRVCNSPDLTPLFSLGTQYVSDFVPADKVHGGVQCPIELVLCRECTLVQLKHTAPQDFLYTRHYWYRSGVTQTMREALADVARAACERVKLEPGDVVLDIGANDGTLLRFFPDGCVRVGVEPADNLATPESYRGLKLIHDFWSYEAWNNGWYSADPPGKAKIVTALGMLYDLEDPNEFIRDVARVLHPEGVFIAQLMCLKQTLDRGDVGNFAHEHLEFYSYRSLRELFERHGLTIFDIEENNVNGGSYRVYAKHAKSWWSNSPNTVAVEKREADMRLHDPDAYVAFRSQIESNRRRCHAFIADEVARGKRVYVLGASTKGNVILQHFGLDHTLIEGASDRSPEKNGLYTIGTGIKIVSEEEARAANPDYFLCLPYAFRNELMQRESKWREGGGKFIFPLPSFEVV